MKEKLAVLTLKIGDVVWIRPLSDDNWKGNRHQHKEVLGETARNWLLYPANPEDWTRGNERYAMRVPKTLRGYEIVPEVEAKRRVWAFTHIYDLCKKLEYFYEPDALIEIAKILKFEIPEDINVKAEASQSPAVEITDGDRGREA